MEYRHKRINADLARKYFSEQYGYAVEQAWIRKPLAWAAYHLWRFLDTHEPERPQDPKVIRMVAGSSVKLDTGSDFRPIAQGEFLARFEDLVRRTPMIVTPDVQVLRCKTCGHESTGWYRE